MNANEVVPFLQVTTFEKASLCAVQKETTFVFTRDLEADIRDK
jgi:hypothetical protein